MSMTTATTPPVTPDQFLQAERQVIAGVFARLLKRYHGTHGEGHATRYAMAVTNVLFALPAGGADTRFLEGHRQIVDQEIEALRADRELREIITETIAMRIVFASRQRGCGTDMGKHMETLKDRGIYLQGGSVPTPKAFVLKAQTFFAASPR